LHDSVQVVTDLGGQDSASVEATLEKNFLPQLLSSLDANSQLANALQNLWQLGSSPLTPSLAQDGSNAADAYASQVMRENAFHTLAKGVGVYLTFLRMRLQWQAAIETQHPSQSASLIYGYFDQFRLEANNWTAKLSQRLSELFSDRKGFVILHPEDDGWYRLWEYYHLTEDPNSWNPITYWVQHGQISPVDYNWVYNNFIEGWTGPEFDGQFSSDKAMISGLTSAVGDWNAKMPPPKPSNSAAPDGDLTKWGADAPQGANWVAGASVRYAVRYANPAGHTDGDWGAETVISTRAFPLVIDLPVDGMNLATARHLRRQFKPAGGDWGSEQIVAIIPDNTTAAYLDILP
jgi:hypothetical protein